MSEASRGTQAPDRPDESLDSAPDAERADGADGASRSDDDFYATVNNAAASRSTRINHPGGDGANGAHTNGAAHDGAEADSSSGEVSGSDGASSDGVADGAGHGAEDRSGDQATKAAGKNWRDRWTSLSGSLAGRRNAGAAEVTDGSSADQAKRMEPGTEPFPSGAPDGSAAPAVPAAAAVGVVGSDVATAQPTAQSTTEKVETKRAPRPKIGAPHRTRKARLRLSRIDPWSVMKTAFLFSIAAGIVLVVAVYVIWTVIGSSGLFSSINDIVSSVVSTPGDTTPFRIEEYVNTQKVMGVTALVAVFDVLIFTALATLASFLYNLAATMLGGLEVTLAED